MFKDFTHVAMVSLSTGMALFASIALADTGPNQRLNVDSLARTHAETSCAASLLHPNSLLVGCNDDSGSTWTLRTVHYFRTADGGRTWNTAFRSHGPEECARAGDPSACSDAQGRFFAVFVCRPCGDSSRVYSQSSVDGGITWSAPVVIQSSLGNLVDKPYGTCDMSPSSPHANNLYVVWVHAGDNRVEFKRSTDHGITFTDYCDFGPGLQPCPAVGPEGTVYVAVSSSWFSQATVYLRRSLDGGVTWEPAQPVATTTLDPCGSFPRTSCPVVACDLSDGPRRGWVYLCYASGVQGGSGGVFVRHSADQGVTWSDSVRVSDVAEYDQWYPWLAVHPQTGDLGVSWLDGRGEQAECSFACYASLSTDGGITWCPNMPLATTASRPDTLSYATGDYIGVTSHNLGFLSAWPDFRNGPRSDIYAAWWNNGFGLQITSPAAGDTVFAGRVDTIRWDFRYSPDTLAVELNRDYPSGAWEHVADVCSRDRMLRWPVSGVPGTHARLRVTAMGIPSVGDTMDGDFTVWLAAPLGVTAYRVGNDLRLRWQTAGAPYYRIYSAFVPDGPFSTLEGSTTGTEFLDLDTFAEPRKFYIVRSSTEP